MCGSSSRPGRCPPSSVDYQLVATLGPASDAAATWQAMLAAGVTAFRLNTSHLSLGQLVAWMDRLEPFLAAQNPRPPLVLDLQGSKWRLGRFPSTELVGGQTVRLMLAPESDQPGVLPVPHADFFGAAGASDPEIVINDAKIRLRRESLAPGSMVASVIQGGAVSSRKGLTYARSAYRHEELSAGDQAVVAQTRHLAGIRFAVSYVRDSVETANYRTQLGSAYLVAKLERQPAVDQALDIATSADELWLCRGDLGAELGLREMAEAAHRFAGRVRALPKPAYLAGQVFEHMVDHPAPTRSELCAAHDALAQGYAGLVLSDETAIGGRPVESCRAAAVFRG
jgi:pyruvate kinase